jgi:hypothetical protein
MTIIVFPLSVAAMLRPILGCLRFPSKMCSVHGPAGAFDLSLIPNCTIQSRKFAKAKPVARGVLKIKIKARRYPKSRLDFAMVSGI